MELYFQERAASEEWRRKLKECEELNKDQLNLAAEVERYLASIVLSKFCIAHF